MNWESISKEDVFNNIDSNEKGLSSYEVEKRQEIYGLNSLIEKEKPSEIKKFLVQFTEPLMILLIIAGIIAFLISDYIDSGVIFFVVVLNAIIGYRQENKAENAMENLKSMSKSTCIVLRDNKVKETNIEGLTLGDVVLLEEGDNVPADLRLFETYDLKINESMLTGESDSVKKSFEKCDDETHNNIAYMDTTVTNGRGKGVVIAIGMDTEMGKIASLIQDDEDETPLQIKIDKLGKTLGLMGVIICVLIFLLELVQGVPAAETFMTAVSLAVAAIPEGLPAILTLTLALGMQKMAKNKVIVRKLLAVETLGSCSVICTDKTGTLTLNKLKVTGSYITDDEMFYNIADSCNNAHIDENSNIIGDSTDVAVMDFYLENNDSRINYKRIHEIPLDSNRKRMSVIVSINQKKYILVKGAPDLLLKKCSYVSINGKIENISDSLDEINSTVNRYTSDSLRVIAFAFKELNENYSIEDIEQLESDLTFVGVVGMMDPPRKEVKKSIQTCKNAGITVKMITGDHKNTASSIARLVGIENYGEVLTGDEIKHLNENQLREKVKKVNVFARVYPEQKLKIVKALKEIGEITAMTGDGVNDAPALTSADIGVSMGSGTDVAKKSSDMILENDDFSTIVYAIKEGRTIYSNIKRFIKFQLSTNIAAIMTILISSLLYLPLPFNPVQLLWINIIMDGPPAQSLGVEPSDKNIMNIAPINDNLLSKYNLIHITLVGLVMAIGTLSVYLYELSKGTNYILASSITFTVFVMYQLFNVFNCKSDSEKSNKTLLISVFASFILQLCAIYVPFLQNIFKTAAIPLFSWSYIIIVALLIFIAEKIVKCIERKIFGI